MASEPDEHVILAVDQDPSTLRWCITYGVDLVDGIQRRCHMFPASTLAWRAAEYGIDPSDSQTLLDVVLHEPHMTGHDHTSPDFLYNCDQDTARESLTARVAEVKTRVTIADPDGHLSAIHAAHSVDPADHAARRAYTDHIRTHGHAPISKDPDRG